ncbi:hypothetical protein PR048_005979, partial [Dryococelus australis]
MEGDNATIITEGRERRKECEKSSWRKEKLKKETTQLTTVPNVNIQVGNKAQKKESKNLGLMQVCGKSFLSILGVSKFRVQNICKQHLKTGRSPSEKCGGDTRLRKYLGKRHQVHKYIKSIKCVESHYTCEQSVIKYLRDAYNNGINGQNQVKYNFLLGYFYEQFQYQFQVSSDGCVFVMTSLISYVRPSD